ncbi:winged helix-turn-helix transcriptional regulator [Neisseria sp. Ec49-e6-T10]|uniref:winged helix-turn-helix transcriptional regulator n=1 Tax=Neisseria sp. Ec49-e6-T10 TaxID=3140744 RepID=UPI003EBFD783
MRNRKQTYSCPQGCPVEVTLNVIGGKWKGVILYHLIAQKKRYSELQRAIPSITPRVLALQLRELEEDGVLTRTVYAEVPPRTEYQLSTLGESLKPIILEMKNWGEQYSKTQNPESNDTPT